MALFGKKNSALARTQPAKPCAASVDPYELAASKAIAQITTLSDTYGMKLWRSPEYRANTTHDVAVMLRHDDLTALSYELVGNDRKVLCAFNITFNGLQPSVGAKHDPAAGVEIPVLNRAAISEHRFLVSRKGKGSAYASLLKERWGTAEALERKPGDEYTSEHATATTRDRQSGAIHVANDARHWITVIQTGTQGYAFGTVVDMPEKPGVFLHRNYIADGPYGFCVGQTLSALLITTPKGIAGRAIKRTPK